MFHFSSGSFQTYFRAVAGDGAAAAPGGDGYAQILSEGHQDIVVCFPMPFGQLFTQCEFGFFGSPGLYVSPKIGDSMHVGIHADSVVSKTYRKHQVCRFPPDARKLQQVFHAAGNLSPIILRENSARFEKVLCLRPVESHGINQSLDRINR